MQMDPYMHNTYWYPDQITITFQLKSGTVQPTGDVPAENAHDGEAMPDQRGSSGIIFPTFPTFPKKDTIAALNVDGLNSFLLANHYPMLSPIDITDTLRFPGATPPADSNEVGKYLFTSRDTEGNYFPTVIGFFKFDPNKVPVSLAGSVSEKASMSENGSVDDDHDSNDYDHVNESISPIVNFVNFINKRENLDQLKENVPIVSASPTWLAGATDSRPVGCPLTPPIPVPEDTRCASSPGLWPITLPELPTDLERMTGDGVNVFILDTLPRKKDIRRAVEGAEEHNLLLLDIANNVVLHHNQLPAQIDEPGPFQPKSGKDIKGRLSGGFRMPDHGLFVAGIVRDIAPNTHVECIRVLNDFCAGDLQSLTKALESIQNRLLLQNPDDNNKQGDLFHKPVVINLSLVIPDDGDVREQKLQNLDQTRASLLSTIQSLVDQGVLFAASAGNEGDLRYQPANPTHVRPNALYPAGFAYNGLVRNNDRLVPVGAVDKQGNPASYSCYPGHLGLATYGGEVSKHFKQDKSGCYTKAEDIDAVIGIYTALSYPALALEDCQPTYPVPNANAWAYWVGTSFATPIISGLTARIQEYRLRNPGTLAANVSVPQALNNMGTMRQITWTRLEPDNGIEPGYMILAEQQCATSDRDDNDEKRERVDVRVTINE